MYCTVSTSMGSCVSGEKYTPPQDQSFYKVGYGFEVSKTCSPFVMGSNFCVHVVKYKGSESLMSNCEIIEFLQNHNLPIPQHFKESTDPIRLI